MEDYARPSITVRYVGATNHRGAKLLARFGTDSVRVSWDSALETYPNMKSAAVVLAESLGWDAERLVGAHVRDATGKTTHYIFVLA